MKNIHSEIGFAVCNASFAVKGVAVPIQYKISSTLGASIWNRLSQVLIVHF